MPKGSDATPPRPVLEVAKTRAEGGYSQPRGIDGAVAELAGRQHGVVERGQLLGLGVGEDAIDGWCRRGRLHRLHAGVYAVGHRSIGVKGRWHAAVLACGGDAVLSHGSAAALWEIRYQQSGPIHITAPAKSTSPHGIRRHSSTVPGDEVTVVEGISVTTVPRTILDLAAVAPVDAVEHALRESEYRRLYDRLSLPDLLARYPGRRGSRAVRACLERLAESSGRVRSPLEEDFLPLVRRHGLPMPRLNAGITVAGRHHQVDCPWPDHRIVVELDGWGGHGTRTAFREDRARDRRLRVAGYEVVRIVSAQLEDEPEAIVADLRTLLNTGFARHNVQTSVITYSE